ncbi:MAG: MerR family transcriptional regulator [Proteobacteria bacterium]|nr:MerR family transcriptional regulator [Pseudomonadota bacterium]
MKSPKYINPDKVYFTIGEVAAIVGVKPYTIRFWEKSIGYLGVDKGKNGRRKYQKSDIKKILDVKHLLYEEGMTIKGVNKHLSKRNKNSDDFDMKENFKDSIIEYTIKEIKGILGSLK